MRREDLDRLDPLCKEPTLVSQLGQLLEHGCSNGVYPTALLGAFAFANYFCHGSRLLVPGLRPCPSCVDSKSRLLARARFNVGSLLTRSPVLSPDSLPGDQAPSCRFALPLDDLVLGDSLLERPAIGVERTELWESVGFAIVSVLGRGGRDVLEGSRF